MTEIKYQSVVNLSVKNNSHTIAYEMIRQATAGTATRVLEVGCSTGYFGAALRQAGYFVWGVESNQAAAESAALVLDRVYSGSIESFLEQYSQERFDFLVFGDVLEHVAYPDLILQKCKPLLNPGGRIVVSLPNVVHIAIRSLLMEGRWDYSELGILDRTHLRFFTRASAIDLFSAAGYRVHQVNAVRLSAEQVNTLCDLRLNQEILAATRSTLRDDLAEDFQYVLSAESLPSSEPAFAHNQKVRDFLGLRLACFLPNTEISLVDVRLRIPLQRWALRFGGHLRILELGRVTLQDVQWADIVLLQRHSSPLTWQLQQQLQKHGKKVIFEIDDLLCDLPSFFKHHIQDFNRTKKYFYKTIAAADVVTVTTDRLGAALSHLNPKTFVIPNCAESLLTEAVSHSNVEPSAVRLIVASSDRILTSFIAPALKEIQKKWGAAIISIGPPAEYLQQQGLSIEAHTAMSYDHFKAFLASQKNAVGVIPLDSSRFSSCKSAIKYLDYSLAGIPAVCSAVPPYSDVIHPGVDGVLTSNTTEDWVKNIEDLLLNFDLRQRIADHARQRVLADYNIDQAAARWQALLLDLVPEITTYRQSCLPIHYLQPDRSSLRVYLPWLLRSLLSTNAYRKTIQVLKAEGFSGLLKKLRLR